MADSGVSRTKGRAGYSGGVRGAGVVTSCGWAAGQVGKPARTTLMVGSGAGGLAGGLRRVAKQAGNGHRTTCGGVGGAGLEGVLIGVEARIGAGLDSAKSTVAGLGVAAAVVASGRGSRWVKE